jgi:hypothetical protein
MIPSRFLQRSFKLLHALLRKKAPKNVGRMVRRARPELESLEDRQVPTVTFHGGPVLLNVEVQALYYGSDWQTNPAQVGYLEGFLKNIVQSSYMDLLTNAGYHDKAGHNIGKGSSAPGYIDGTSIDNTHYLTDGQLQSALKADIKAGHLQKPDANRLYVIFVEDNVAVDDGTGHTSVKDFYGYHTACQSSDGAIPYAVIPYPHGTIPVAGGLALQRRFGNRMIGSPGGKTP